jgi:hypothetical protein
MTYRLILLFGWLERTKEVTGVSRELRAMGGESFEELAQERITNLHAKGGLVLLNVLNDLVHIVELDMSIDEAEVAAPWDQKSVGLVKVLTLTDLSGPVLSTGV